MNGDLDIAWSRSPKKTIQLAMVPTRKYSKVRVTCLQGFESPSADSIIHIETLTYRRFIFNPWIFLTKSALDVHGSAAGVQWRLNNQDFSEQYTIQNYIKKYSLKKTQNKVPSIDQAALGPISCAIIIEIDNGPDPSSHIAQILTNRRVSYVCAVHANGYLAR